LATSRACGITSQIALGRWDGGLFFLGLSGSGGGEFFVFVARGDQVLVTYGRVRVNSPVSKLLPWATSNVGESHQQGSHAGRVRLLGMELIGWWWHTTGWIEGPIV